MRNLLCKDKENRYIPLCDIKAMIPYYWISRIPLGTYPGADINSFILSKHWQRTGGMWLIHGTPHCKENKLQSLELLCWISSLWIQLCTYMPAYHVKIWLSTLKFLSSWSAPMCDKCYRLSCGDTCIICLNVRGKWYFDATMINVITVCFSISVI